MEKPICPPAGKARYGVLGRYFALECAGHGSGHREHADVVLVYEISSCRLVGEIFDPSLVRLIHGGYLQSFHVDDLVRRGGNWIRPPA